MKFSKKETEDIYTEGNTALMAEYSGDYPSLYRSHRDRGSGDAILTDITQAEELSEELKHGKEALRGCRKLSIARHGGI